METIKKILRSGENTTFYHLWSTEHQETLFLPLGFILSRTLHLPFLDPEQHLPGQVLQRGSNPAMQTRCPQLARPRCYVLSLLCGHPPPTSQLLVDLHCLSQGNLDIQCVRPAGHITATRKIALQDKSSFKTLMLQTTTLVMGKEKKNGGLRFKVI